MAVTRPCDHCGAPLTRSASSFKGGRGLTAEWGNEFVWCNPPYGPQTWRWLDRLNGHPAGGIALIFARTETAGFFRSVWNASTMTGVLFLEGRLFFHHVDGTRAPHNSGAPSCLVAYGDEALRRVQRCGLSGALIDRPTSVTAARPNRLF